MALKMEDLLKYAKSTELAIKLVEDDSSDTAMVKILNLINPVTATGSNLANGHEMHVTSNKVYVAAENIEEMLKGLSEKDGILMYKGEMHLDVSKPSGRDVNGQFKITKQAKIWLTKTKFSRMGNSLMTNRTNNLNNVLTGLFSSGKAVDLTAPIDAATAIGAIGDGKEAPENGEGGENKPKIEVIGNKDKNKENHVGKTEKVSG